MEYGKIKVVAVNIGNIIKNSNKIDINKNDIANKVLLNRKNFTLPPYDCSP